LSNLDTSFSVYDYQPYSVITDFTLCNSTMYSTTFKKKTPPNERILHQSSALNFSILDISNFPTCSLCRKSQTPAKTSQYQSCQPETPEYQVKLIIRFVVRSGFILDIISLFFILIIAFIIVIFILLETWNSSPLNVIALDPLFGIW